MKTPISQAFSSPASVLAFSLFLVIGSSLLLVRSFSVPESTHTASHSDSSPRIHYIKNPKQGKVNRDDLRAARDVLSSPEENKDLDFIFSEKGDTTLIGRGVVETGGEFQSPSTQLSLVTPDGSTELVTDKTVEYSQLSKDGTKILYITPTKKTYLYDIATKSEQLVTSNAAFLPDLCTDNSQIVYKKLPLDWAPGSDYTNSPGLAITTIANGSERQLTTYNTSLQPSDPDYSFIGNSDYAPTFSPDCTTVVFFSGSTTGNIGGMFMVNADGSNRTRLTNQNQKKVTSDTIPSISDSPLWSPDGTTFIYESGNKIFEAKIDRQARRLNRIQKIADGIAPKWEETKEGTELKINRKGERRKDRASVKVQIDTSSQ